MTKKSTAKKATKKTVSKKAKASSKKKPFASLAEEPRAYRAGQFRFIDLFCGIGGFRIAFEKAGAKCVFSSDYDKFSQQTYEAISAPSALSQFLSMR